jgi:DnaK suppressor protein
MDTDRARALLTAEQEEVSRLLRQTEADVAADTDTGMGPGDAADDAQSLQAEGTSGAIAEDLRARLDAIGRALRRLDEGTYGRSVRSGDPIPDQRLEADPPAQLTNEEAKAG